MIDESGKQVGIMDLEKAIQLARSRNLDLIQVTEKVDPPVCKIGNYGKYLYQVKKKEKTISKKQSEIKTIRLGFGISPHDLEIRTRLAEKFLKKGHKVRIELILRGRQKTHLNFGKDKINLFLEILKKSLPVKIEREIKKEPRGLTAIISKG